MERGTTLADPVDVDHKPNLQGASHEIGEYLQEQGAYDLFSYLLRDLLMQQPADPLQHMLKCLQTEHPLGPLKVVVSSPPCIGRSRHARRLAEHFGLQYIGAAELLQEGGLKLEGAGSADEAETARLVMARVSQCTREMQGFVLDGFPRTRFQTSFLKDLSVVPTHVLALTATAEEILQRHRLIAEGQLEADEAPMSEEEIERKLRWHSCHSSSALEPYKDKIALIPLQQGAAGEEAMWRSMEACVRMLPRSRGPAPPPRVVLFGPRGVGAKEHASRLAARLGAVFVDGAAFPVDAATGLPSPGDSRPGSRQVCRLDTTAELAQALRQSKASREDALGALGKRLRDPDCAKQGWVMCGFPLAEGLLRALRDDPRLAPSRAVILEASAETCVRRLRNVQTDSVTGRVWTELPKNEAIRMRLVRRPEDHPNAVREAHAQFCVGAASALEILNGGRQCAQVKADGPPEAVHSAIVEFVERPLPLPPRE